jgi:epoxyqueuosine reductase
MTLTEQIKRAALEAGFDKCGVAPAELPASRENDLTEWLARGYAGSMHYMTRDGAKRARPSEILAGAQSVISLGLNYFYASTPKPEGRRVGRISLYARGRDYHRVIEKKLKKLKASIQALAPAAKIKSYVDTGPIMEKAFAQAAGIGFYGKNTNILTADRGSWIFLASLVTDLALDVDKPHLGGCGSCRLCIDACPTSALVEPYRIDATKCISYWTIESKEEIPDAIADRMGDWAFGCDACQDVCPYNRKAKPSREPEFAPERGAGAWLDLEQITSMQSGEDFAAYAQGTPLKRPKLAGLKRNAGVILRRETPKDLGDSSPPMDGSVLGKAEAEPPRPLRMT